mgnify:CR=1 FL=1
MHNVPQLLYTEKHQVSYPPHIHHKDTIVQIRQPHLVHAYTKFKGVLHKKHVGKVYTSKTIGSNVLQP